MTHSSEYRVKKHHWTLFVGMALVMLATLAVWTSCGSSRKYDYNVLVIHTNMESYPPYERYNKSFAEAIDDENVSANIEYFYLDCERYNSSDEISRLDSVVNSHRGRKLDLIVVNGDQATYSLLSTHNPLLKKVPVVFGAVRYPNWKLLAQYADSKNVTGLHDSMDVVKNLEFIRDVTGSASVITQIDDSYLDRQTEAFVDNQLAEHPEVINNMHWKYPCGYIGSKKGGVMAVTSVSLRHSERMASESEVLKRRMDKTVATCGDDADRKVIGSQNYFFIMGRFNPSYKYLMLKNESGSRATISIFTGPVFTAIDDNFDIGAKSKCIGGYFTTWETTAAEEAKIVKKILVDKVKPSDIPITVPKKEYVADWNAHNDEINADWFKKLPPHVTVKNMPFKVKYPVAYFLLVHGTGALLVFLAIYCYMLFRRERKKKRLAYQRLIEEKENLKLALIGSKTYAWMLKDGKAEINKNFFEDMNIPAKSWRAGQKHDLSFVLPQYRDGFEKFLTNHAGKGRRTFQFETDFGDGVVRWWEVRSTTLDDKEGHDYIVGLLIDIGDIKKHEKEIEAARLKAEEGERLAEEARRMSREAELKQSFLANMSHEIRTPLNAIVGFTTLIAEDDGSMAAEEKDALVEHINHSSDLLLRLVNDVLDLAQIEAGKMEFDFNVFSVNTLLDDTYKATHMQMPNQLEYIERKCAQTPSVIVDAGRLQQVLSNFITNAGKFTPEGSVTLGCVYDEKTDEVEFYVEDTGLGLTPAEQKLVFDRFYKSDNYRQGTGLGLAISKAIVERLNGRIELQSEKGKGSRFSVFLRVCV